MANRNASVWIKKAKKAGLDVDFLHQDKGEIYRMMTELNLPMTPVHILNPSELDLEKLERIFKRSWCFSRLIPRDGGIRPYKFPVKSVKEFLGFIEKYDLAGYSSVHLVEKGDGKLTHTGCIIARDESPGIPGRCLVELVEGNGEDLFHGLKTPIRADIDCPGINWFRTIKYNREVPASEEERKIVLLALKFIGGPKHPFPGYWEFDVMDRKKIMFRNYQDQETAYAKI